MMPEATAILMKSPSPAANDENGGFYIFEYRDGEGSRQVPPSRMPSFEAAREEAIRCAIDLLVDLQPGTDDLSGWLVRVRDENGELLCAIDVQEAEAARQAMTRRWLAGRASTRTRGYRRDCTMARLS